MLLPKKKKEEEEDEQEEEGCKIRGLRRSGQNSVLWTDRTLYSLTRRSGNCLPTAYTSSSQPTHCSMERAGLKKASPLAESYWRVAFLCVEYSTLQETVRI